MCGMALPYRELEKIICAAVGIPTEGILSINHKRGSPNMAKYDIKGSMDVTKRKNPLGWVVLIIIALVLCGLLSKDSKPATIPPQDTDTKIEVP